MEDRVKQALNSILEAFKSGTIPETIAYSTFPPIQNIPMNSWSFLNRTLAFLSGTADARGFRQWQSANRRVKKGARALYILVPMLYKKDEESVVLRGFKSAPVFKVEDTEGEPLDYQKLELPEFPLMDRAKEWGVSVKAVPGNYRYYGYFSQGRKEIALATREECVFFHELAHCAHSKIAPLKPGQDPFQEIVAELGAQALCRLAGKTGDKFLGNSFKYIESYAGKVNKTAHSACLQALSETEKVLTLILKGGDLA